MEPSALLLAGDVSREEEEGMEPRVKVERRVRFLTGASLLASSFCRVCSEDCLFSSSALANGFRLLRLMVGREGIHRDRPAGGGGDGVGVAAAIVAIHNSA